MRHLTKKWGNVVRAWLAAIDQDQSLACNKAEFFRAVRAMEFRGDAHALWRMVDSDGSGQTASEDTPEPEVLACR